MKLSAILLTNINTNSMEFRDSGKIQRMHYPFSPLSTRILLTHLSKWLWAAVDSWVPEGLLALGIEES